MTQEINCNFKSHIPRIMTVPGILLIHENKLVIYYSDQEWYKFSNLSKSDLIKLTKYLY